MAKYKLVLIALIVFLYIGCTTIINPTDGGIKIFPATYDFEAVFIGDTVQVDFTVKNNYKNQAILTAINIMGDDVNDFRIKAGGIVPASIEPEGEHTITVEFVPKRVGVRNAYLNIEYNATGGKLACQLKGVGVEKPVLEVTPAAYDYGNVGINAKVDAEFTIKNNGNKNLIISDIAISDDAENNFSILDGGVGSFDIVLNPGETHTFKIAFQAQTSGEKSAQFKIYHNAGDSPFAGDLTCFASTEVSLSPLSHVFEETEIGDTSKSFKFSVSNPLSSAISISDIKILDNPGEFTATPKGTGNWTVPANGGIYEIFVTFNPGETGILDAKLQITHTEGTLSADLSGVGVAKAKFEIDPTSFDFGTVEPQHAETARFTVKNAGTDVLRLNSVEIDNDSEGNYIILTGNSGTSINVGSFAIIEVRFLPKTSGLKNAILRIEHNADELPVLVTLSGLSATIALTPSFYNYGNVGLGVIPAASSEFEVVNATSEAITISNISIDGLEETSFAASPSGRGTWVLNPGSEPFRITVTCSPKKLGELNAILKVTYNAGQLTSDMQANGIPMPRFAISPENYDFGTVELSKYKTYDFILRNYGSSELTINDISIVNDPANNFEIIFGGLSNGSTAIPMNNTRTVRIKFAPKEFGSCAAKLHIEHNANGSPFNGNISGRGTGAYLTVIPDITEYDFGNQFVGKSSEIALYLHNAGNASLNVTNITVTNTQNYSVTHDSLPILLEAGKISVVKLIYHPTASGVQYATLDVTHSTVNSPLSIAIKGTGKKYVYYMNENFEGNTPPGDWWATPSSDWQWGRPINVGPSGAYEGSRCYGTDINSNYRSNQNCVLVSPSMNLRSAAFPVLKYFMWMHTQLNYDGYWIEISTDDGGTWTKLTSPSPAYNSSLNVSGSPTDAWSGNWSTHGWVPVTVDLSAYKGYSQVRLLWYFYSNSSATYPGVYIDEVTVFEDIGPDTPRNPVPVVNDVSVPLIQNKFKLKWDCDEGLTYDVYLDTKNPPTVKVATGINAKEFTATMTADKTYFWQIVAHNSYKSTNGPIWYFKTVDGVPRVLINEVDTSNNNDYIEFYNTESYMVYIGKWQMSAYDNGNLQGTYEFDDYIILYPKEVIVLHDRYGPSTTRFITTFNILWTSISSTGEVIWQYPHNYGSIGVDYMRFNVVVPNYKPADLNWSGLLTASSTSDLNWYRNSATDTDSAGDWNSRRVSADIGVKNPGQ